MVSELKFYFNKGTHEFELDQNPHGEPNLTKMNNLRLSADAAEMEFDAVYRGKNTSFKLSSEYPVDKILYQTMAGIAGSGFAFRDDEHDSVELIFEKGALSRVQMHKYIDIQLAASLRIIREEGGFFLIKQKPYAKIPLNSVGADDKSIVSKADSETFRYSVDVQEYTWDILKRLINGNEP